MGNFTYDPNSGMYYCLDYGAPIWYDPNSGAFYNSATGQWAYAQQQGYPQQQYPGYPQQQYPGYPQQQYPGYPQQGPYNPQGTILGPQQVQPQVIQLPNGQLQPLSTTTGRPMNTTGMNNVPAGLLRNGQVASPQNIAAIRAQQQKYAMVGVGWQVPGGGNMSNARQNSSYVTVT